jgi:hypothetical protein
MVRPLDLVCSMLEQRCPLLPRPVLAQWRSRPVFVFWVIVPLRFSQGPCVPAIALELRIPMDCFPTSMISFLWYRRVLLYEQFSLVFSLRTIPFGCSNHGLLHLSQFPLTTSHDSHFIQRYPYIISLRAPFTIHEFNEVVLFTIS